jgi:hypothetical protein
VFLSVATTGHQQPKSLLWSIGWLKAHDAPLVHYGNTIRQRADLIQLGGDQQDCCTCIAVSNELTMNELDGPDVYTPCGL